MRTFSRRLRVVWLALLLLTTLVVPASLAQASPRDAGALGQVVPVPASVQPDAANPYQLSPMAAVSFDIRSPQARQIVETLAGQLRTATGYPLPVVPATQFYQPTGISLLLGGVDGKLGDEAYQLRSSKQGVVIKANAAAGLFRGVQTLKQLLPAKALAKTKQQGPFGVPGGTILDHPRYGYRSAMLDVARHFFTVPEVESYIDEIAQYKINYLHLHLTDSQGWRIQIDGWPKLTEIGGSSGVGGERTGFYTQADYSKIVEYAQQRFITVVPEIEGPSHSNAARSSYAGLNCDGKTPPLWLDITESPNSVLCLTNGTAYKMMDDVIRQLAKITPGPYINIAGDEVDKVDKTQYAEYVNKVSAMVAKYGKKVLGWQETLSVLTKPEATMGQFWFNELNDDAVIKAAKAGAKVVMSPADHAYLDMKYDEKNPAYPVGNYWAGFVEVQDSYNWDPETQLAGLPANAISGVSAAMFTELVFERKDIDQLAFPRLAAIGEIGWSPKSTHDWDSFKTRLAAQGPHMDVAGIDYYRSPQIPWPAR
ncbi:beta-N-acetylhexosaminidase [Kutzneria viridogrisea]|uniref:beta-N-acetylhexosaminidase n=1 Tax=Kutzneria viridogrisea TaxID=47990 RepID=A0ABR6BEK3_9PSEU|nr:hexosaminidase [Kutzneria viridogrisea]